MGFIESILLGEVVLPVIIFILGFLASKYIHGTKHQAVFAAVIRLIEVILESYNISVPEFLQKLLKEIHEISEDTGEYEKILNDEIIRLEK